MKTINKPTGQVLKDFDKMMKEIRPYLPSKMRIFGLSIQPYELSNIREYNY